jgi:hypothetical protein
METLVGAFGKVGPFSREVIKNIFFGGGPTFFSGVEMVGGPTIPLFQRVQYYFPKQGICSILGLFPNVHIFVILGTFSSFKALFEC